MPARSLVGCLVLACAASRAAADEPLASIARDAAVPPSVAHDIRCILSRAMLIRNIPARTFATDGDTMEKLFEHPPLTAAIVRGMGLGDFRVDPRGAGLYRVREGRSIEADFRQLYRREGLRLFHIQGQYYGSFFIHLSGEALLLARYYPFGRGGVAVKADAALCVDNRFYGFLVSLFAPLFKQLVDGRFSSYMDIAGKLSEALAGDPEGVYNRLTGENALSPGEREEFRALFLAPGN